MQISIAERLRPFCHVPGTSTLLPGLAYHVQIFPCLIRISHLKSSKPQLLAECLINLKGPLEQFTFFNDLEKGRLTVSGKSEEGWIRYHLISALEKEGVRLLVEKAPSCGFSLESQGKHDLLRKGEWRDFFIQEGPFEPYHVPLCDRLSLGNHKAQDWELIKRRFDFTEILPLLHRLGQLVPSQPLPSRSEGTLTLLEECTETLSQNRPDESEKVWRRFLMGCFNDLLVPQLEDVYHQGLVSSACLSNALSPLVLLSEGSQMIRRLFIQQVGNQVAILPHLLPSLHCGRLLHVSLEGGGWIDFEWTKKSIRRLVFLTGTEDREYSFKFPPHIKSYRLREQDNDKGERKSTPNSLFFKKNCYYLFDNFQ